MAKATKASKAVAVATGPLALAEEQLDNGAKEIIESGLPYRAVVTLTGSVPMIMHGWNVGALKGKPPKGTNKKDILENYVYRDSNGNLGMPGYCFTAALVEAGRYRPDPRSPRKSLRDLMKAAVSPLTIVAPFEPNTTTWDYEDARRAVVQRAGITRVRPAMREGWKLTFEVLVNLPEYIEPTLLMQLINEAGTRCGLGDFRPTYGRFVMTGFELREV